MSQATRLNSNKIAVVFDFDETLTPEDSFRSLLRYLDLDIEAFETDRIQPLLDAGWEKYLARAYCLIEESHQRDDKITKETLAKVGQEIPLHSGTQSLFKQLEAAIEQISPKIELEFYLISGGFVDIAKNTSLAKDFKRMWGCEFHYGETADGKGGEIEFVKRQMTHVEKTRYLYYISKGIDGENSRDIVYGYEDVAAENIYVPLDQVIYVGDGASDVPCFAVMNQYNGISLGIYKQDTPAKDWKHLEAVGKSQRLSNLVPPGYEDGSELMRSLLLSVESIAKRIALRQMSRGE